MAERHVANALTRARESKDGVITAAADPNQFIDDSMYAEFFDSATASWGDGMALIESLAGTSFEVPIYGSIITSAVNQAASQYMDMLSAIIGDRAFGTFKEPIFGEFLSGNLVQYGDIRPILATLGGGSPDPVVPLMGGITTGRTVKDWMDQNGIASEQMIWLYGFEDQKRRTFNGHLQMDGLVFDSWEDDGLTVAPQDAWLRDTHYRPGDHWGCACVVAPYIPNFGPDFTVDLPTVEGA